MKKRNGFVSNSSTSSFVCDVCSDDISGMDISFRDYDWAECVCGHILCHNCKIDEEGNLCEEPKIDDFETDEEYDEAYDKWAEETEDGSLCTEAGCPICQFIEPSQGDAARYLEKEYKTSREEVFAQIKALNKRRKKLYDHEYIAHVCQKHDINLIELLPKLKERFGTYKAFLVYLRG